MTVLSWWQQFVYFDKWCLYWRLNLIAKIILYLKNFLFRYPCLILAGTTFRDSLANTRCRFDGSHFPPFVVSIAFNIYKVGGIIRYTTFETMVRYFGRYRMYFSTQKVVIDVVNGSLFGVWSPVLYNWRQNSCSWKCIRLWFCEICLFFLANYNVYFPIILNTYTHTHIYIYICIYILVIGHDDQSHGNNTSSNLEDCPPNQWSIDRCFINKICSLKDGSSAL